MDCTGMRTGPNWRMPAGIFAILGLIALLGVAVGSLAGWIGTLPALVQAGIYLFAGIVWIAPLKPLLRWMETGRFRGPSRE